MGLEKNNWYKQSFSAILNLINSHKNKEILIIRQEFSEISFFYMSGLLIKAFKN